MSISFSIPRDSLEPNSGVSTMGGTGGVGGGAQVGGVQSHLDPKPGSQAWSWWGSISSQLQTPVGHMGGTDVLT